MRRILLISALAACLAACSKGAPDLLEQAKRSQARGDTAGAVVELKQAIQLDPVNAQLRFQLGTVYNNAFDGVQAEKELIKARELGLVEGGRVTAALARALWLQGNNQALMERIEISPDYAPQAQVELHTYRGQALAALGKLDQAKQSLAEARRAAAGKPLPIVELLQANVQASEGNSKAALATIEQVLQSQPGLYDALALRADIVRLTGDPESAVAAYTDLLRVHPTHLFALIGRSTVLMQLGKFDAAEKDVEALHAAYKNHFISHFQDGLLRFRKGQFRTALESFQRALKVNPTYPPAQLYEGMTQLFLGNARSAQHTLNQYVTARPDDLLGRRMWAAALVRLNESARALEVMAPVLESGQERPEFWEIAADAYARLGQLDKAAQWLEKLERAQPAAAGVQLKQADVNMLRGRPDLAMDDYAQAARLSKNLSSADTMLVLVNLWMRDFDRAFDAVKAMEAKAPADPFVANLRAVVLLEQGKRTEAAREFEEVLKKNPGFLPAAANLARLDLTEGKAEQAKKRFEAVLAADKNHMEAMLILAGFEQTLGHAAQAKSLLERAAKTYPTALEPRRRLVQLLLKEGQLQEAREHAEEIATRSPNSIPALELLANVKLRQGDKHSAVATFTRISELQPKAPGVHVARARAERLAGMPADAEASLRKALALQKTYAPAQEMLFELLMQQKRTGQALEFARQLQADYPKSAMGYMLEGEVAAFQKKYKEAVPPYRKALELGKTPQMAVRTYIVRVLAGDDKAALTDLQRWVAEHPRQTGPRMLLGHALMNAGDYRGALNEFHAVLRLTPADPVVAHNLAIAYGKTGNPAEAERFARGALKLAPQDASIKDTLGWILFEQGKTEEARDLLAKAAAVLRDQPAVRYHYAAVLAKSGDKGKARAELAEALQTKQSFRERDEAVALMSKLDR